MAKRILILGAGNVGTALGGVGWSTVMMCASAYPIQTMRNMRICRRAGSSLRTSGELQKSS
jgi:hypothetical protein